MKHIKKMKLKSVLLFVLQGIFIAITVLPVQAQVSRDHRTKKDVNVRDHRTEKVDNPFMRLKKEAQKAVVEKTIMEPVEISANNPNWKGISKPEIKFVPFELEDDRGNAIPPDRIVTLENGKRMTAQELLDKTNELEKKLNAQGYSLRDSDEKIVSTTETDKRFLDGRRSSAPKSIAPFKTEAEVQKFMSLEKIIKVAGPAAPGRSKTTIINPDTAKE